MCFIQDTNPQKLIGELHDAEIIGKIVDEVGSQFEADLPPGGMIVVGTVLTSRTDHAWPIVNLETHAHPIGTPDALLAYILAGQASVVMDRLIHNRALGHPGFSSRYSTERYNLRLQTTAVCVMFSKVNSDVESDAGCAEIYISVAGYSEDLNEAIANGIGKVLGLLAHTEVKTDYMRSLIPHLNNFRRRPLEGLRVAA